ncbi:MAG TPA: 3-oxoadipate enol-lactonase [Thermoleophilaceae bacterium]
MTELFAVEDGDAQAPPLVLGSSLGATLEMWDVQTPRLAEHYRVIRYDHRGHGRSPVPPRPYEIDDFADDVVELLDRLGIEQTNYCGLSIGGMTGISLAAHHPERVERLVVCCSSPHMPPASNWQQRAKAVLEAGSVEVITDAVVDRWLTPEYAAAHPDVRERLRAMLAASPPDGYAAACGAIERMDLRPLLGDVRAPTLVIAGARDLAAPPDEHSRVIADGIPNARLELVDAAHVANVQQAERVTELIIDHLEGS